METTATPPSLKPEDGYELWLRYRLLPSHDQFKISQIVCNESSDPLLSAAVAELQRGLEAMLGHRPEFSPVVTQDHALLLQPSQVYPGALAHLTLNHEAFAYLPKRAEERQSHTISASSSRGVLYGAFWFLRQLQMGTAFPQTLTVSAPSYSLRMVNHWDNLNRTVERGYAGQSIWDWHKLPDYIDPRIIDYARANASIGINSVVLTNVNANSMVLRSDTIVKTRAIADVLRPYGIKVFLTSRFSAPEELGNLTTSDPRVPDVQQWWCKKVSEIYDQIPDFGGFLVKANSEGQPGPQSYGLSHAEGARVIADALAPFGGVLLWRAFVYDDQIPVDRAAQAYAEFKPLDGLFQENVFVQVKNGPIDFQPREPFSPLFGAVDETSLVMEVQATKEYLGFASHLAYLGTMWEEVLKTPTQQRPAELVLHTIKGVAGVSNIGSDRNWCGSHFDQSNWYALGRLSWDPTQEAREIANEWVSLTFGSDVTDPIVSIMMRSREAVVDYTGPLGLTHLMATGHHYGPGPWVNDLDRADWNPTYFHRANKDGIGFDRVASGTIQQYAAGWQILWGDPKTTPENLLLWFHHLPWSYELKSGRSVWEELVYRYSRGVAEVKAIRQEWSHLTSKVDPDRFTQVAEFLKIQEKEALWWRDASLAYWQSLNGLPYPEGFDPPQMPLEYYQGITHPFAPGNTHTG
ncbi:MAG: hypothetical protein MUC92_12180 [Fimbriimonadaceae bacterium]|jgi:alpha-glucuronidase|nr:hypothetical protein [Fimbriimonadaceae bacterium]